MVAVFLSRTLSAQIPVDSAKAPADTVDSAARITVDTAKRIAVDSIPTALLNCGHPKSEIKLRRAGVAAAFVGGNAALYSYFKRAWWSGERADRFFFHADWDENFRDQDKLGHMLGGYHLARFGNAFVRSTCTSKTKAIAWSAAYAAVFQLQIEIWDGMYKKYGFSYADLLANTTGTALAVLHETHPRTRAIKPLISYHKSAAMRNADNIPGELRPSLDYTGQTYWMSVNPYELMRGDSTKWWLGLVRLSVGHSITDWIDPRTGANIRAQRKILLTLDIDAEKLPGENRIWKTFKRQIGYIHLPSPALQITPTTEIIGWYK